MSKEARYQLRMDWDLYLRVMLAGPKKVREVLNAAFPSPDAPARVADAPLPTSHTPKQ